MIIELILNIAAIAATALYLAMRLVAEMQMAQQNSYRIKRYGRWLKGDLGNTVRSTDLLLCLIVLFYAGNPWAMGGVFFINILKVLYRNM